MKDLNPAQLLKNTKSLVSEERRITLQLIAHLREIERRLLFAEWGYGSLFEFCTKELGLSEGSAQRRIQAMRLVRDVPTARMSLENGELSLSNAARVQSFFQAEKKNGRTPEKQDVIKQVVQLSQRECEQKLFEISPQSVPKERERVVSAAERELKLIVSEELYEKLQRLRGHLAHSLPEASYAELLEYMVSGALEKFEKKRGSGTQVKVAQKKPDQLISVHTAAAEKKMVSSEKSESSAISEVSENEKGMPGVRIKLPVTTSRSLWSRAGNQCEYRHEGRRCTSAYRLEIDHIKPLGKGGSNELSNLRIFCRTHNAHAAVKIFGAEKIERSFARSSA